MSIDTSIAGLAQFAGAKPPKGLLDGLNAVSSAVQAAQKKFDTEIDDAAVVPPLVTGLRTVRVVRSQLRNLAIQESARFEIQSRSARAGVEFSSSRAVIAARIVLEARHGTGIVVLERTVRARHGGISSAAEILGSRSSSRSASMSVHADAGDGQNFGTAAGWTGTGRARGRAAAPASRGALEPQERHRRTVRSRNSPSPADARLTEP